MPVPLAAAAAVLVRPVRRFEVVGDDNEEEAVSAALAVVGEGECVCMCV